MTQLFHFNVRFWTFGFASEHICRKPNVKVKISALTSKTLHRSRIWHSAIWVIYAYDRGLVAMRVDSYPRSPGFNTCYLWTYFRRTCCSKMRLVCCFNELKLAETWDKNLGFTDWLLPALMPDITEEKIPICATVAPKHWMGNIPQASGPFGQPMKQGLEFALVDLGGHSDKPREGK